MKISPIIRQEVFCLANRFNLSGKQVADYIRRIYDIRITRQTAWRILNDETIKVALEKENRQSKQDYIGR